MFVGADGIVLEVRTDSGAWLHIHAAWDAYMGFVALVRVPSLTDRDTRLRKDPEWLAAAATYLELRTAYDGLSTRVEEAKAKLAGLTSHAKEQGGGVSVTRLWKRGQVDYTRVPELEGTDLEAYRAPAREELRVTTTR